MCLHFWYHKWGDIPSELEQFYEPTFLRDFFYETFMLRLCKHAKITRENADHFKNTPLEKDSTHSCIRYMCMRYLYAS